jgi:hypothetical protein
VLDHFHQRDEVERALAKRQRLGGPDHDAEAMGGETARAHEAQLAADEASPGGKSAV